MEKTISVADLKLNQQLDSVPFSLKEFEKKLSRQGKDYYNVNLGDKTGEIRGKLWSESIPNVDADASVGDIVAVTGIVQEYAGKPQIIVEKLKKVEGMPPEEFLPVTARDRGEMQQYVEQAIDAVKNPYLKQLLDIFWNDDANRDKFLNFPAAEYVHHAYVGGMMEHVWEMYMLSEPFYKIYPQLDKDLITTGIFFHDIGKLEELDVVGASIVRTNAGKLLAHIGQGIIIVDSLVKQIQGFPEDLKNKLYHMVLSHQGKLEYGSPVVPLTLEAIVVSIVDMNSADMNQATKHIEKELHKGSDFTEYHRWLKRSLYQKDYLEENE